MGRWQIVVMWVFMRQHNTLAVSSLNDARTLSSDSNCCYCQLSHWLTDDISVSIVSRSPYTQPLTYVSPISRNLSLSGSVDRVTDIFFLIGRVQYHVGMMCVTIVIVPLDWRRIFTGHNYCIRHLFIHADDIGRPCTCTEYLAYVGRRG